MIIKVKDLKTGVVYTSEMSSENKHLITSMHFCTSYTQVTVQDEIETENRKSYPEHDIIIPPVGSKPCFIDLIATQGDNEGEFVK